MWITIIYIRNAVYWTIILIIRSEQILMDKMAVVTGSMRGAQREAVAYRPVTPEWRREGGWGQSPVFTGNTGVLFISQNLFSIKFRLKNSILASQSFFEN
jgi:hypothetical protein